MTDDAPLPPAPAEPPPPALGWLLLAGLTALACYLRLPYLHESLWLDELHTSWTVIDGWVPIRERAEIGNYSPLYFWFVRGVTEVAGHHEWSLRLISIVAGTALVPAVGLLTWRWTGALAPGLLAAWMATVDEHGILFSVEARPYALVALLAALHVGLSAELLQSHTLAKRAAWILLAAAMIYLHYTAGLLILAEVAAYLLLALWRRMWPAYGIYYTLIDGAILLLLCSPAIWHLLSISSHRAEWEQFVDRPGMLDLLVVLPVARDLALPLGIIVGWVAMSATGGDSIAEEAAAVPAWLPLSAAWLVVPLVTAWILSVNDLARIFHLRYLYLATPALFVLAAVFLQRIPSGWPRAGYALVIAVVTLVISPVFPEQLLGGPLVAWQRDGSIVQHATQGWKYAISKMTYPPLPLLIDAGLIEGGRLKSDSRPLAQEYLTLPVRGIYRLTITPIEAWDGESPSEAMLQLIEQSRGVKMIVPRSKVAERMEGLAKVIQHRRPRLRLMVDHEDYGDIATARIWFENSQPRVESEDPFEEE